MPSRLNRLRRLFVRLRRVTRNDQVILTVLAVLIGAAASYGAIAFRELVGLIRLGLLGRDAALLDNLVENVPWWQLLLVPALGGLAVGLYIHFFMPRRRPQGVAQVIEASAFHGGRMSLTTGLNAAIVSAASIGVGASVGREGPVVHLGASIGAWIAKRLHLKRDLARTLLGCGVAAAVAASFNAPIAGVFFSLEVVIGRYALSTFAPIVIASVTGTIISRLQYGDFPAFIVAEYEVASFWEFPAFAILGVVSAVLAIVLMRSIVWVETVSSIFKVPDWTRPAIGGLGVGVIAIAFPHVLGVGYESTDAALKELFPLWLLIALIVAKTAATAVSLGMGFGGGVFSPSLFLGAMVGGAFGIIAGNAVPDYFSGYGAYTMVGMGAVAGAVLGAPISTILIIFELTADYQLTVAVMIATVIASVITQQWHGHSFFRWQLERRGYDLADGREMDLLRRLRVELVMSRDFSAIPRAMGIVELRARLQDVPYGELFVVDEEGLLYGTITLADLSEAAFDHSLDPLINAGDVARLNPPTLNAADDLEKAMNLMNSVHEEHIPVIDNAENRKLIGLIHERDVMLAYNRELVRLRREESSEAF